jgi:hypothetical protein
MILRGVLEARITPLAAADCRRGRVHDAGVFQDAGLPTSVFEPIRRQLVGLNGAELDQAKVMQFGLRGRRRDLLRDGDEWRSSARADTTVLRIEVPASSPPAAIHLAIGTARSGTQLAMALDEMSGRRDARARERPVTFAAEVDGARVPRSHQLGG